MKMERTSIRMLGACVALALVVGMVPRIGAHDGQMPLSFDSIFPTTPYKDALGSCMQVLGYLDQLCHEHERGEQTTFGLVHDAFLGKVVLAQHKVIQLLKDVESGALVADDNVVYLSALLGHISQLYQECIAKDLRNTLALSIIDEMTVRVSRITQE